MLGDAPANLGADRFRRSLEFQACGHVEKGFVQRQAFDQGREFVKDRKDLRGDFLVARHARRHNDGLGTAAQGLAHGHGGAHAEAPYRVARRRDDAAAAGSADDERRTLECRAILLFHGRVKSVHVDVQDRAQHYSTVTVIFFECSGGSKD